MGGNTADYARYAAAATRRFQSLRNHGERCRPQELGGFLQATGWKLIWALNLGSGYRGRRGRRSEGGAASRAETDCWPSRLATNLTCFPHAKHRPPGYGYEQWLADYRRYKTALRAQLPGIPFAGPDVAGKTDWVTRFAADEGKDAVLLTHHYYREGQNPGSTIEKLLGVDPKLQPQLDQLRAASQSCGVPYRICEVNSFSGGGRPGVSDTMAAALWVLDYMFTLASNGCSGVNMETGVNQLGFISSYSPIGDDEQGHYSAKPEYYGMLAFSLAGRGELLAVGSRCPTPLRSKPMPRGPKTGALVLTLINKGEMASILRLDTGSRSQAGVVDPAEGPAVDAKTGNMLGGAEITRAAPGRQPTRKCYRCARDSSCSVPAASAAIVSILQSNS